MQEETEYCSLCKKPFPMDVPESWTDQEGDGFVVTGSSVNYAVAETSVGELNVCEECADQLPDYLIAEDRSEIFYQFGLGFLNAGDPRRAIDYFIKAEKNAEVLFSLGNAYSDLG